MSLIKSSWRKEKGYEKKKKIGKICIQIREKSQE